MAYVIICLTENNNKKGNKMSLGLLGQKLGMTRIFADDGSSIPVTVVAVGGNRVVQVKTNEVDGYTAVQVAFGERRASRVNKAAKGHFAKAGVEAGNALGEFKISPEDVANIATGSALAADIFTAGQLVDVTGTTKGKGFSGVIKRHHFSSNRASHGNSRSHNTPGSIGQRQDPGRVFPGKKMAGHLGNVQVTAQNLEIVRVDVERGLLLVKGAIPGSTNGKVIVRHSVKAGA
jgi:large subunit ribosomal protein L3